MDKYKKKSNSIVKKKYRIETIFFFSQKLEI